MSRSRPWAVGRAVVQGRMSSARGLGRVLAPASGIGVVAWAWQ